MYYVGDIMNIIRGVGKPEGDYGYIGYTMLSFCWKNVVIVRTLGNIWNIIVSHIE